MAELKAHGGPIRPDLQCWSGCLPFTGATLHFLSPSCMVLLFLISDSHFPSFSFFFFSSPST